MFAWLVALDVTRMLLIAGSIPERDRLCILADAFSWLSPLSACTLEVFSEDADPVLLVEAVLEPFGVGIVHPNLSITNIKLDEGNNSQ